MKEKDSVTQSLFAMFPGDTEDYRNLRADYRSILADWYHRDAFRMGQMWEALRRAHLDRLHQPENCRPLTQDILERIPEDAWISFFEQHPDLWESVYGDTACIDGCVIRVLSRVLSDNRLGMAETALKALDRNPVFGYPQSFFESLLHYPFASLTVEVQRMLEKRGGQRIQPILQDAVYRSRLLTGTRGESPMTMMIRLGMKYKENSAEQFVAQTKFMEGYTPFPAPEATWNPYSVTIPTYNRMSRSQLDWYFYWREEWKKGHPLPCSPEYVYLYAFTLMNRIGAEDPLQAFQALQKLCQALPGPDYRLREWIHDFAVFYQIPGRLLEDFLQESDADITFQLERVAAMLKDPQPETALSLALHYTGIPEAAWERRRHYRELTGFFCEAVKRVRREYEARNGKSFIDLWVGRPYPKVWEPMSGAPVLLSKPKDGDERRINDYESYRYLKGRWIGWHYYGADKKWISSFIKMVDIIYRRCAGIAGRSRIPETEPWLEECLVQAAEEYLRSEKTFKFRTGALEAIRRTAEKLQERLVLEEETDTEPAEAIQTVQREKESWGERRFTEEEEQVLRFLLEGNTAQVAVYTRKRGQLPQVLYESINEKALEWMGDTLIEDGIIYEEYHGQVKEYLTRIKEE